MNVYSAEEAPLPIVSNGNVELGAKDVSSQERVSRLTRPIFEAAVAQAPKETISDTMSIDQYLRVLWRPNNYRRKSLLRLRADTGLLPVSRHYAQAKRSGKGVWVVRDYPRVTVMIGPRMILGIWSQQVIDGEKEVFLLESDSAEVLRTRIMAKTEEVRAMIDRVLVDVVERLCLQAAEPFWDRYEDFIKDERIDALVARLPSGCVVHESFFKKVYEQGVEFVQSSPGEAPGGRLSTYLRNRAFEDVAPEVAAEIAAMRRETAEKFLALTRAIEQLRQMPARTMHEASQPGQKRLSRWIE